MKQGMADVRDQLGVLGKLMAEIETAERRILASAEARLRQVDAALESQRLGGESALRHAALIEESAQLRSVIKKAQCILAVPVGSPVVPGASGG